jgi:hypothetical protein
MPILHDAVSQGMLLVINTIPQLSRAQIRAPTRADSTGALSTLPARHLDLISTVTGRISALDFQTSHCAIHYRSVYSSYSYHALMRTHSFEHDSYAAHFTIPQMISAHFPTASRRRPRQLDDFLACAFAAVTEGRATASKHSMHRRYRPIWLRAQLLRAMRESMRHGDESPRDRRD